MSLLALSGTNSVSGGYDIDNSIVFETANSERVYRANGNSGQRRTFTISAWVKRTALGYHRTFGVGSSGSNQMIIYFKDTHEIVWYDYHGGSYSFNYKTNRLFRDTSAWYHLVFAVDTEQSTEANRVRLYVNGVEETSFATQTEPSQNRETNWNYANGYKDVGNILNEAPFASCYMSEVYHINDQQLAPTNFGEFDDDSGIWKPKAFSGTFGSEDSYLNFDSSGSMGADSSGNSNNFDLVNITAADQATDTPTNNFCTFNAVNMYGNSATLKEGATFTASTANGAFTTYGTMAPSSGKWWWEGKIQVFESGSTYACIGATTNLAGLPSVSAQLSGGHVIKLAKNQKWVLNSTGYTYGATYADADIINVGLDLDNRKFYTYKNGTIDDANGIDISSSTFDGFGSQWMPLVITYGSGGASSYEINFGGYRTYGIGSPQSDANGYGTFEYAPPSGYYALCTKNLEEFG